MLRLIWLLYVTSIFAEQVLENQKCGYNSCHATKSGYINVHIVPHTHDDVGWVKTVDEYYYGGPSSKGVKQILDSVSTALHKDKNRRFIYVESAFLFKWWKEQTELTKTLFKKLVNNGQLEFVSGGWSMNDEATTNYQSIIDQFTLGLRRLNDTFGKCGRPKIGWQIDPFGHSREMASILAQLGFDGLLLGRIDYQDKSFRFHSRTSEILWQGSQNLGNQSQLFTSVMYNIYSPPPGFCFDIVCSDAPIIDDKRSPDYNVDVKWRKFKQYIDRISRIYTTNNMIITMGGDFTYMDAHSWYISLDRLISYANQRQAKGSKYNLIYSTPSCYLKAVHDEAQNLKLRFQVKTDDFFPYASDPHAYWTGYFTSKPTIKRFERLGNNFLQVCKQLYALTNLGPEDWADLNALREAMGVMQHHDAITGTMKDHVAHDYARILSIGLDECEFTSATALSKIVTNKRKRTKDPNPEIPFKSCILANLSQCEFSEKSDTFIVTIYNPLSRPVNHYVRLPVLRENYKVIDSNGTTLPIQAVPIPEPVKNIPGRQSNATIEIVFLASGIPPLGFRSYYVEKTNSIHEVQIPENSKDEDISIKIDDNTGLISEVMMKGRSIHLSQNYLYYRGTVGNNRIAESRSSGAYIFRPNDTIAYETTKKVINKMFKGNLVTEIHQTFNEWVSQVLRYYNGENYLEFDWLIGPIPINDDINGREVISRFTVNMSSESTFYTDSNGREILKRIRNFRPTWKLNITEAVSSNYYPVTSKILIRDPHQDVEVAVLTDRAQGGTSLKDGEIELMVHRRCIADDAFGVKEPLNETAFGVGLVARGSHYVMGGAYNNRSGGKTLAAQERDLTQRKLLSAWTFFSPTNGLSYEQYKTKYAMQYSGLKRTLPDNVQILTLEPWLGMNFLLRLEHVLEMNEDPILSKPVTVNLKGLFTPFEITSIRETTLGANQWLDENERLKFQAGDKMENTVNEYGLGQTQKDTNDVNSNLYETTTPEETETGKFDKFSITLNPMQIRTFVIDVKITNMKTDK